MTIWLRPGDGGTMTTSLQVAADHSLLRDSGHAPVVLAVSPGSLVARHWPQGRPGLLQLERAIDTVEHAIEQAGVQQAQRGVLHASASLRQLLPRRFNGPAEFSLAEVEAEFSRLVAACGAGALAASPAADLAPGGEAAAALLLVREVMHHLGFQALGTGD